jgi:hypothetical protein
MPENNGLTIGSLIPAQAKILVYDLADPDARHAGELADSAERMMSVLWDYTVNTRTPRL